MNNGASVGNDRVQVLDDPLMSRWYLWMWPKIFIIISTRPLIQPSCYTCCLVILEKEFKIHELTQIKLFTSVLKCHIGSVSVGSPAAIKDYFSNKSLYWTIPQSSINTCPHYSCSNWAPVFVLCVLDQDWDLWAGDSSQTFSRWVAESRGYNVISDSPEISKTDLCISDKREQRTHWELSFVIVTDDLTQEMKLSLHFYILLAFPTELWFVVHSSDVENKQEDSICLG